MMNRILSAILPLKNFRRGFATNSSSSHSFVYLKKPNPKHNKGGIRETEFQWNDFKLSNLKSKLFYVLAGRLGGYWTDDVHGAYEQMKGEFPEFTEEDFAAAAAGLGVDHESVNLITLEQARDPRVVVFGGNDNGGASTLRANMVARNVIDWTLTRPNFYEDHLTRDEFPVQPGDSVQFTTPTVSTAGVWRVSYVTGVTASLYQRPHPNSHFRDFITMEEVNVNDLELVKEQ